MPGVRGVAFADDIILGLGSSDMGVGIPGYTPTKNENMSINYNVVSPGYFSTLDMKLLRGRDFTARDDSTAGSGDHRQSALRRPLLVGTGPDWQAHRDGWARPHDRRRRSDREVLLVR